MENFAYLSTFSTKECLFVELLWFYIMHTIGAVFSKSVESFDDAVPHYPKTMGGKVWWREVAREGGFRIQQNILSGHYRLLDGEDCRVMASFERECVEQCLAELLSAELY